MTTRLRDALPERAPSFTPATRIGSTRSGIAKLIELDDADAWTLTPGDTLVARFGYGLAPVEVVRVKTGVAGEGASMYEVPVIDARIPTGQVLAYAPEELCRVRESKRGGRA